MRIGELAKRTGASARLLRYYEEQGLITPDRNPNGYRDYDERLVDRVQQIRGLLEAGLPTRMIKRILPCLNVPGILYCPEEATPEMVAALEDERDRMTERIRFLTHNRDAITAYIDAARAGRGPLDRRAHDVVVSGEGDPVVATHGRELAAQRARPHQG